MVERIRISNGAKKIGSKDPRVLWKDVSFTVNEGELFGITGPSGAGKSTLLNCLGQLDTLDEGDVFINGTNFTHAKARQKMKLRRRTLGFLFQDYALVDNETAAQNVAIADLSRTGRSSRVREALAQVGLDDRSGEKIYALSGGEQQRVAVARLLVRKPEIILADEPTASLDRDNAAQVLGFLRELTNNGCAVIMVSHDPWAINHCDNTYQIGEHEDH